MNERKTITLKRSRYDYIVYIGRFSPPHNGHINTILHAFDKANRVIVLVGSSNQARNIKNPWTWEERANMIKTSIPSVFHERLHFVGVKDYLYNEQQWVVDVQESVKQIVRDNNDENSKIAITGYDKDESSYYIKSFPQWNVELVEKTELLNATNVREAYFKLGVAPNTDYVPPSVSKYLLNFKESEEYSQLVKEYHFIEHYKERWANAPYPPIFVTVDAVVVQSGHVLLVKRRAEPGKGLIAFPGGFLNQNEMIKTAVIRELREETKLKVQEKILERNIIKSEVFDHPKRSLRGRTVTHAFLIELHGEELPKVRGDSDAEKAFWMPISDALEKPEIFFEDHFMILKHFLGGI